ncbi:MAG TPA: cytochrome c-type biogenesis protein [Nevskiales bacterium]|nr:cytochrome c-type biogenesis protein [Nevskiales bacterium]
MRAFLIGLLLAFPAWADMSGFTPHEEARYQRLIGQLRCLVCQNQTIAESNAPLAQDLRNQVQTLMRQGRSDAEILQYLTERYGDFVLYRPPLKRSTWLLWGGPFLLLALALLIAALVLRHRRVAPPPAVDDEALRRILEDRES